MSDEITAQEFIDGGYRERIYKDVLVWHKGTVVESVESRKQSAGTVYRLYHDDGGDYPCFATVTPYELLTVEDISDRADLRRQMHALVDQLPDDALVGELISMRAQVAWVLEYTARRDTLGIAPTT